MIDRTLVAQLILDQMVADRKLVPSFIKIDVEGYEEQVLRGSMEVIGGHKPILMIEIEKRHNTQFRNIFSLLSRRGYVPYHFCHGKFCISGPAVVDESYEYLKESAVSGVTALIRSKNSERYINNFVFLPVS
jgi:hypothetical protein